MKRYTPEELEEVVRLHGLWLRDEPNGARAYLSGAYLSGANLSDANLSCANLSDANLSCADLSDANLSCADLSGANLSGADLSDANLSGAYLSGAYLSGANLSDAYLSGAYLSGAKLHSIRVFTGLYEYECWSYVLETGEAWVRMGCLWKSVQKWDEIGIKASNPREFPDDGSKKSERRARAFEYVRNEALLMAEKFKKENSK